MFGSAMPSWKKRSGKAFPKSMDFSDSVVSAPTTTTLGFRPPRSTRARPKYERWLSIFQGPALTLDPVPVDDGGEVVEAILRGGHRGLPRLAHVLLAVAEHAIRPPGLVIHPWREGQADGEGEALTFRPRGVLHARRRPELRMALQAAVELPERHELLDREEAALREGGVPHRAR